MGGPTPAACGVSPGRPLGRSSAARACWGGCAGGAHVRYRHFLPENVLGERVSLGVVAAGDSVPVPARFLSQTFDDLVVQVRPAPPAAPSSCGGTPRTLEQQGSI